MTSYALGPGATLIYHYEAIRATHAEVATLMARARAEPKLTFTLYGKPCTMQRHQLMFGKDYAFSGRTLRAQSEWDPLVRRCVAWANARYPPPAAGGGGPAYNAALVNYYHNGSDYISPHRDKGEVRPVLTFTFGAVRRMHFAYDIPGGAGKKRAYCETVPANRSLLLEDRSCAVMAGPRFQAEWTHCIRRSTRAEGPRLSVTVRAFPHQGGLYGEDKM